MKLALDSATIVFAILTFPACEAACASVASLQSSDEAVTTGELSLSGNDPELRKSTERASELTREGRLAEALAVLRPAVEIARASGNNDLPLAAALNNLGSIHDYLGRRKEAAQCYREALSMLEAMGVGGSAIVTPLMNLGRLRSAEGKLAEAEAFYSRAVNVISEVFGSRAPEVGVALNGLAEVSIKRRRYPEAERHLLSALQVLEDAGGTAKHRAMALFLLSTVRNQERRVAEAESLLRRAIADWEESVGRAHPTYVAAITKLAVLISKTKPGEAEVLFKGALSSRESQLGPDHPETGRVLSAYARLLRSNGRKREAKALEQRAERIARSSSPQDLSPYTIDISALEPGRRN